MMVRAAEEEAVMKHYILTHPEHFPEPKKVVQWSTRCQAIAIFFSKVKYLDKLEPWTPVRV